MPIQYDGVRIIKPNTVRNYTKEQLQEIVRCSKDINYFACKYYTIVLKKGSMLIPLHEYQKKILKEYQDNKFTILLSARQVGKTTCTCIFILWYSIFNENKTCALLSNTQSSAASNIGDIQYALEELPYWMKPGVKEYNKLSILFDNGSKIIAKATTKDSLRGESVSCVTFDTKIQIRNKLTHEIKEININDLFLEEYK